MKRLFLATLCGMLPCFGAIQGGGDGAEKMKLDGAWRLAWNKTPGSDDYVKLPEGWQIVKLVVGGRFAWTIAKDGKVLRSSGGKMTYGNGQSTEQIEFVSDAGDKWMIGRTGTFKAKLDGSKWYHEGVVKGEKAEAKVTQIWERITNK